MAEFIAKKPIVVKPGDPIDLPEKNDHNKVGWYRVDCIWKEKGEEKSKHWDIYAVDLDDAYDMWREEYWKLMFDPFKIKISMLTVTKID